jgi:hypothetical protein
MDKVSCGIWRRECIGNGQNNRQLVHARKKERKKEYVLRRGLRKPLLNA